MSLAELLALCETGSTVKVDSRVVAALVRVAQEANILTAGAISVDGEPNMGNHLRRSLIALTAALERKPNG